MISKFQQNRLQLTCWQVNTGSELEIKVHIHYRFKNDLLVGSATINLAQLLHQHHGLLNNIDLHVSIHDKNRYSNIDLHVSIHDKTDTTQTYMSPYMTRQVQLYIFQLHFFFCFVFSQLSGMSLNIVHFFVFLCVLVLNLLLDFIINS